MDCNLPVFLPLKPFIFVCLWLKSKNDFFRYVKPHQNLKYVPHHKSKWVFYISLQTPCLTPSRYILLFLSTPPSLSSSPPQPFSLRKACQRKSSQVEDIVERLWQAESHSNGSIMSLIMVCISIIYQGWGPGETEEAEENDDCSAGWQAMMSLHSQW